MLLYDFELNIFHSSSSSSSYLSENLFFAINFIDSDSSTELQSDFCAGLSIEKSKKLLKNVVLDRIRTIVVRESNSDPLQISFNSRGNKIKSSGQPIYGSNEGLSSINGRDLKWSTDENDDSIFHVPTLTAL